MLQKLGQFATKTFLLWMLLVSVIAFIMPHTFTGFGPFIPYLLGVVMLGMGLTIKIEDFKFILKQPKPVLIGVVLQYTIMPLLAYSIAKGFQLPPDIAIGVMLVGCCPGGTSSNVVSYLAKANVALSVTVTSVSTLLLPILTPSLMYVFANQWMDISFMSLFSSVIKVVIVPIAIGLVLQKLFKNAAEKSEDILPVISVIAISLILGAVIAASKDMILQTGLLIFIVVILHNTLGYLIGYVLAHCFKLSVPDKKALSIEVGMQNSGLAASLATVHFNPLAAVPGAVFSFIHCVSGPLLAKIWTSKWREKLTSPRVKNVS
ncbi:bile acid:sodium symporter family protein [Staphylococcus canis]|uniref:Bile acid:sodium symporter family protein n=1 Tax=Staphylococcus canis TaxID=2724942 RepID=A0ABS0TAR2_9STAP|nr:bile acid:sodium symporter family protein [Staphylococcus canis]MBI5975839.1 bile acid:sodium symporter family protein [Staphylococcus canis]